MSNGMFADEEERRPKSLLTGPMRFWLRVCLGLAAVMLANTAYLLLNRLAAELPPRYEWLLAEQQFTISKLFQVMVLGHTGVGLALVSVMTLFAVWHLPRVWKRHRAATVATGLLFVVTGGVLTVTGLFVLTAAQTREHAWVWWVHVAAAAVIPLAYLAHRAASYVRPTLASFRRFAGAVAAVLVVFVAGHALSTRGTQWTREAQLARAKGTDTGPGSRLRDNAKYLADSHESPLARRVGFVSESFVPPGSPFFPSAATTTTGDYLPERIITRGDTSSPERLAKDLDTFGFAVNERIGADTCQRCHPDVVEQWAASAHRFASFNNPFYEATINDMRENAMTANDGVAAHARLFPQWEGRTGMIKSKWCSGCHDPAIMLAGKMTDPVDRRTPQAQAGLTCLACHAIDSIHNNTGNGGYNIADEQEDPYLFPRAKAGTWGAFFHDQAIKAKPDAHKRQMLKPFFRTSEFCGACHKVSLQEPVNSYRWLRGQNEYDNWHDSGVALNAARTFYLPPQAKVCQDCHMPPEPAPLGDLAAKHGMVRSHRFLAVNTALPFVRGDNDTIRRTEAFLRDEKMRIDVFALVRERADGSRETVYALDRTQPRLRRGETVTFDVVVRNKGVGHTFPGGTNDSNESWIEFSVLDEKKQPLFESGYVRDDGYVDPAAHFFRAVMVDRHSNVIRKRNAQDIYAPVYVSVVGPGTAHTVHYRVTTPESASIGALTVRARLMWRKFDRAYTEFAFNANREAFKRFDRVPDLPITEICASDVTLRLDDAASSGERGSEIDQALAADWMRFNDYGIGLLLQRDTKGAEAAFAEVARLDPQRIDGPRNLARVAIEDGNLPAAYKHLLRCEELVSNDPQTAWFWGVLLQEDGRYVEAASAYQRVLQKFPRDRATWRNLGRTYYLDGKYEKAVEALANVIEIDPEDRVAHYHLMLAARALGREKDAQLAEAAYLKYKLDESADEVTQNYRLRNPHDNRESQPVHVHDLTLPADQVTGGQACAGEMRP